VKVTATLAIALLVASAADSCAGKGESADPPDAKAQAKNGPTGPVQCPPGTGLEGATPPEAHRVWCATDDGISHGPYLAWFDDGQKKTEGLFRNGNAHGKWKHWHQTGAVRTKGEYRDGEKVGEWSEFDAEGRPVPKREPWGDEKKEEKKEAYDEEKRETKEAAIPSTVGIPTCDRYIYYYSRCIEARAPEAIKAQMMDAVAKTIEGWKQVASGPGKDALATTCQAALDAVSKTAAAWGCEL
jgi:hypothetical protein